MSIHRKDKRVIQVICNSANAMSGSTTTNATFMVDWNAILEPQTPYHVHFTYLGGVNTYVNGTTTATNPALLWANFNTLSYIVPKLSSFTSTNGSPVSSGFLGVLEPEVVDRTTRSCFLRASTETNNAVWMERRPLNNMFNIKILDTDYNTWVDQSGNALANWVLNLHFIKAYSGRYREIVKPNIQLVLPRSYGDGANSSRTFYCNFNDILDMKKKYLLSFVCMGGIVGSLSVAYISLNFSPRSYFPAFTANAGSSTAIFPIIGRMDRKQLGNGNGNSINYSTVISNKPVFIDIATLSSGYFHLQFFNFQLNLQPTISGSEIVLILNFQEV